jgi:hypothetical protein
MAERYLEHAGTTHYITYPTYSVSDTGIMLHLWSSGRSGSAR